MPEIPLDPAIASQAGAVPIPTIDETTFKAVREGPLLPPVELSDRVERIDHIVSKDPKVVVRVHRPRGPKQPRACVYSIHGGGYVIGSYTMDDPKFDRWCPHYDIVGVSVEYRLAPETPYPGPLEDCYAGLRWTIENAASLGIDPDRIGITGTSAGGGLCAALALLIRERGEFQVRFQLLDCPMLDDRQRTPSSQSAGLLIWSRESNAFGWRSYLGDLYGSDDVPYLAAPARASDLSRLPEAYVCVGAADGFRDENIEYAMRLNGAGVPTELHVYPGAPHGVAIFAGTDVAKRYTRDLEEWLGRRLAALAGS
jgi:acetyl esterase/lipase